MRHLESSALELRFRGLRPLEPSALELRFRGGRWSFVLERKSGDFFSGG